jgi:hypothetical protein
MGLFGDMISKLKGSGPSEPKSGVTATPSDEVISHGKYKVVRVQPTPNPEAFQFTVTSPVIEEGRTKTFDSADDAEGNPFAEKMFQIFGVQTLFLKGDFVTIPHRWLACDHGKNQCRSGKSFDLSGIVR